MSFNTSVNFSYLVQTAYSPLSGTSRPGVPLTTTFRSNNIQVTVYPVWYSHNTIEWSVPADWGNCRFNVYGAQTEDGPFELLNPQPINGTFFKSLGAKDYRKYTSGKYVVEVILLDKANVAIRSNPITAETKQSGWVALRAQEIQRREYWLLSRFAGIQSYLFRKKHYGMRCSNCWSFTKERIIKDNCNVCFGTSFEGGYWDPVPLYIQYETTPNDNQKTYAGVMEPNQVQAWTISLPEIYSDDVIIRTGDWSLYNVERITPTELQTKTVRQILTLNALSKSDIEYKLLSKGVPGFPSNYYNT